MLGLFVRREAAVSSENPVRVGVGPHSMDRFFVPVSRKIDRGDPWNSFHLVWAFGFTLGRLSWEFTCGERLKDVKRSQPLGPLVGSCIPGIIFLCPQV